jgi:ribosomal-protein-alanine N-acetyltransferase
MEEGFRLRTASAADLGSLLTLEQGCAEAPHWSPTVWLAALGAQTAGDLLRASFLAEDARGVLGFAVAGRAGDLAELESVVVAEAARRKGIGKALCLQVMEWARNAGASQLELEVRVSSEGALSLYRQLGFVEQGRRRAYYRNPTEDAVLMAVQL